MTFCYFARNVCKIRDNFGDDDNDDHNHNDDQVMLGAFPLVLPDFPVRVRRSDSLAAGHYLYDYVNNYPFLSL